MHTTHSDGTLTPRELVARAKEKDLFCIALTDHDTVTGVLEAQTAGEEFGVEVIPGVEVSVIFGPGTMHILGYFLNTEDKNLQKGLASIQEARRKRNPKIIEQLNSLGMKITLEEVAQASGGDQVGRPHFAKVMIQKKYVRNSEEAFKKYLGKGAAAYEDKRNVTSEEAIRMICGAGGVASLAHPKQLKVPQGETFENEIAKLIDQGLSGLEVYSSCQSREESQYYKQVADRFGLVVTGGSDFHGQNKPTIELGWMGDGASLFYDTIDAMRLRARAN